VVELLKILFYVFLGYLLLRVFFSLVGPWLARRLVIGLVRRVQRQAEQQANARARASADFEKEFFVAPDVKATVQPRPQRSMRPNDVSRLADDDVEFEELK